MMTVVEKLQAAAEEIAARLKERNERLREEFEEKVAALTAEKNDE